MSPNKDETAVWLFHLLFGMTGGCDHWLSLNRASALQPRYTNKCIVGWFGIICSDKPLILQLDNTISLSN